MTRCYIGLGSNQGDSMAVNNAALEQINAVEGIELISVAPFYCTAPQGYTEQNDFINTVAEIETVLDPLALLGRLQEIENGLGRVRTVRWGPRTVDLDILLYGDQTIDLPDLQVPHPRMHQRAFVMVPLADLNPGLVVAGEQARDLAGRLAVEQRVERLRAGPIDEFDDLIIRDIKKEGYTGQEAVAKSKKAGIVKSPGAVLVGKVFTNCLK